MTPEPYSEADTRRDLIDRKLALAGWNVSDPSQVIQELDLVLEPAPRVVRNPATPRHPYEGPQFADYGLLLSGRPAAVVEAKKTSRDVQVGQEQALQYAERVKALHGGATPFVMYTNGYDTFFWDSERSAPARVAGFPSRDDLHWLAQRRDTMGPLSVELINTAIAGRDYQVAAIRTLLEAIEAGRRKFLAVMATGTGKTRTAVALVDVLLRARWAKRALFLVDRIALQEQALGAFKEHLPSSPRWPDQGEVAFDRNR